MEIPAHARDLIARQHGVIARHQALAAGLPANAVNAEVHSGRWRPLQRGVYATFPGSPSREALLWAALLRAGPGAVLSHETAAELAGLTGQAARSIHVTVPATRQPGRVRDIPGVTIHRSLRAGQARQPALLPPQTRVEDTVLDLAHAAATAEQAFTWVCRAVGRRLTTPERLRQAAAARSRLRWRTEIDAALVASANTSPGERAPPPVEGTRATGCRLVHAV